MLKLKDLNMRVARLELRIEQLRIHLQSLALQELVSLKEKREQLEAVLELEEVA